MIGTIAIIGAGIAGVTAAEALRAKGFDGSLLLFNAEPEFPYDRPPLSKAYAAGAVTDEDILLRPAVWYDTQNITLLQNVRVSQIAVNDRFLFSESGAAYHFDKVILATGASARCLPGVDTSHSNVLLLRNIADARRLRANLRPGAKIILVGGGVIGMECAATAVQCGCSVVVLEGNGQIMARFLQPALADIVTRRHRAEGVEIRTGVLVAGAEVTDHGVTVRLIDGSIFRGDLLIVGIGAVPEVGLATAAGLEILAGGIAVDRCAQTSHPAIYAIGDCTAMRLADGRHVRMENWTHAVRHAEVAASALMGQLPNCDAISWVWSDQYDMNIQVTGAASGAKVVLRGGAADQRWTTIHVDDDGTIVGATTINNGREKRSIEKLIALRAKIPLVDLGDESRQLKSFLDMAES